MIAARLLSSVFSEVSTFFSVAVVFYFLLFGSSGAAFPALPGPRVVWWSSVSSVTFVFLTPFRCILVFS